MHVGVDAPVVLAARPGPVVLLAGHAGLLIPEVGVKDVEGFAQQVRAARVARGGEAGRGEDDEGMGVGHLVRGLWLGAADRRQPAAELVVAKPTGESGIPDIEQGAKVSGGLSLAHHLKSGHMGHPSGDPRLDRAIQDDTVVRAEPAEAAIGVGRVGYKRSQAGGVLVQALRVRGRKADVHRDSFGGGQGKPVGPGPHPQPWTHPSC